MFVNLSRTDPKEFDASVKFYSEQANYKHQIKVIEEKMLSEQFGEHFDKVGKMLDQNKCIEVIGKI